MFGVMFGVLFDVTFSVLLGVLILTTAAVNVSADALGAPARS